MGRQVVCRVMPCHTDVMANPIGNRQPTISLRISSDDREQITSLARENERTPSGEIRRAIRYYLANFNAVDRTLRRGGKELR